jgi:hypothetical protein
VAYHRDHDVYPDNLNELVPEYLKQVPNDPFSGTQFPYVPNGLDLPLIGTGSTVEQPGPIKPHTPFFWSVGLFNSTQLVRTSESEMVRDAGDPNAPPEVRRTEVFRLMNTEVNWSSDYRIDVFVLRN